MQPWRVQPITVMALTVALVFTQQWPTLFAVGLIMMAGGVFPSLNLFDRWVALVTRRPHRTVLHPKRFAAGMGGIMLMGAGIAGVLGWIPAAYGFAAMTFAAAFLLAGFKFCVGCWLYNLLLVPIFEQSPSQHRS